MLRFGGKSEPVRQTLAVFDAFSLKRKFCAKCKFTWESSWFQNDFYVLAVDCHGDKLSDYLACDVILINEPFIRAFLTFEWKRLPFNCSFDAAIQESARKKWTQIWFHIDVGLKFIIKRHFTSNYKVMLMPFSHENLVKIFKCTWTNYECREKNASS